MSEVTLKQVGKQEEEVLPSWWSEEAQVCKILETDNAVHISTEKDHCFKRLAIALTKNYKAGQHAIRISVYTENVFAGQETKTTFYISRHALMVMFGLTEKVGRIYRERNVRSFGVDAGLADRFLRQSSFLAVPGPALSGASHSVAVKVTKSLQSAIKKLLTNPAVR